MKSKGKVLLTGVTGFLGSHTTIQLLGKGYEVIGTLRNMDRAPEIRAIIASHTENINNLNFAQADLLDKDIWKELTQGIDYVQHIASPFPRVLPKNEEELIEPARNGTLYVLEAAAANGVKRTVLTSSTGAIMYGKAKGQQSGLYNESDWSDETNNKDITPYFKSKTIAEKAAWAFMEENPSSMELSTVCPGAILGPVLEKDFGTSANIIVKNLDGSIPAYPNIGFDSVDVRSVADLLIKAMETPEAAGERFIASSGYLAFGEVARILKEVYPKYRIPSFMLPNFMVRLFSNIDPSLKPILLDLGLERRMDHSKALRILKWEPIPVKEAVLSCAESLIKLGIVK